MSTIAFVGCVKAKRPGVHPAGDKYTSDLFITSRAYAERHADRWYILSAKHGLLAPDAPIDDYDETLKDMNAQARRSWAERVAAQIQSAEVLRPGDRVLWLAGRDYKDHVEALLPLVEHLDPMRGLGIGSRLGWLTRANAGSPVAPTAPPAPPPPTIATAPHRITRPTMTITPRSESFRGSKYDPLREYLAARRDARVTLSFSEIESILGAALPRSAYDHRAWWGNDAHAHADAWRVAGYRVADVKQSRASGSVTFERS